MLTDSTGIKFLGEGEWKTKKHGAERCRQWRKVHLGIDAENMQIRAMVVTTNEAGDSPVAAGLLRQIPSHEIVASFTGDDAYDTKDVHEACLHRKAIPVILALRSGIRASQRSGQSVQEVGPYYLEALERLPPSVLGGDEDELLEAPRRKGDG